jgi:predicted metal-dependent HD superfamily phosphohydrolase
MPANVAALAARWRDSWQRFGIASQDVEAAGKPLLDAYAGPARFYHGLQHLEDVIWYLDWAKTAMMTTKELVELTPGERVKMFGEVELALFYHDAVYDPKTKDNEEKSRDWFLRDARRFGLPDDISEDVAHLIELTMHHKNAISLPECVMADCDLSILGAEPEKFRAYDKNIRREYAHVPAAAYKLGRRKVLQGFLDQPQIFKTRAFFKYYEAQARMNLQTALSTPLGRLWSLFHK